MGFVRRLVGSKPKRKRVRPLPPATTVNRSVDDATVFRPVPQFDEPAEEHALSDSGTRAGPDRLAMLGVAPPDARPSVDDTADRPSAPPEGDADRGADAATVYVQVPEPVPPPRRQVACLTAIEGELSGQVFAVLEGTNQLGRSPDAGVVLPSRFVSRIHARIVCEGGKITFVPVSEQLTLINGEAAVERDLIDGDEIQLGRTKLQLRVEG